MLNGACRWSDAPEYRGRGPKNGAKWDQPEVNRGIMTLARGDASSSWKMKSYPGNIIS